MSVGGGGKRCAARTSGGYPCKNPPARGGVRCRFHGGATPQAKRRAEQRLVEADAMRSVVKHGYQPVANPVRELAMLAGEALEMKNFLLRRVTSGEIAGTEGRAYERWLDRVERLLTSMARLNIEERARTLAKRDADVLILAMTLLVTELGQDVGDPGTRELISRCLREAVDRHSYAVEGVESA